MSTRNRQAGITLIVSLIMLIVLTLLVVSAIRFGNINLRIAGNAQTETETVAATQVAIEKMVLEMANTEKVDTILAQPAMQVSTGGKTYSVNVQKPTCVLSKNVPLSTLNPKNVKDIPCFADFAQEVQLGPDGLPLPKPTACRDQQWDVSATLADTSSGANVTMLQGVSLRVSAEVQCP